jgi:hypothetical protein
MQTFFIIQWPARSDLAHVTVSRPATCFTRQEMSRQTKCAPRREQSPSPIPFLVRWIRVCPVTSLRPLYHGTVATDIAVLPPELEFFLLLYHYQDAPLPNCQAEHRNHQTTIVTRLFMLVCHRSSLTHDSAVIPRSTEAGDAPSSEANPVIRHRASSSSSSPIHTRPCFLVFSLPALPPLALPLPQDVASDSPV